MTEYRFNAGLARTYGVDGAIFLHAMAFWVGKNQANGRHFHQGRTWTYNTQEALTRIFPFWTRRQIARITGKLREQGALLSGRFGADKTDRTLWYALSDAVLETYGLLPSPMAPDGDMDCTEPGQPCHQTGQCNKETGKNQFDSPLPPKGERRDRQALPPAVQALLDRYAGADRELAGSLEDLMEVRTAKRAVNSPRAVKALLHELDRLSGRRREDKLLLLRQSVTNSWKSVFPLKGQAPPRKEAAFEVE